MEGLSIFPLEIEWKILGFAMMQVPIDLKWNKRIMGEWGLTKRNLGVPHIPNIDGIRLSNQQNVIASLCLAAILRQEDSLSIESFTRAGKTTVLTYLVRVLHYIMAPTVRICYLSSSLRHSHLAREKFLEFLQSKDVPKNISFDLVTNSKGRRGQSYDVIIYDSETVAPTPFFEATTSICCCSRWVDPQGHLGNNKTLDLHGSAEDDARRLLFSIVLSLPYNGTTTSLVRNRE